MTNITGKELVQKYLDFFKSKKHAIIESASLIPENDPTVLFTTAGMHPLVPFLMGEKHPLGKRVANVQKCIRTGDIEDVGDNRHLTFFEMLGNWSFGDYFKKEAIEWSFEFLTDKKWLGLDPKRIYITVFMGNKNSPIDEESINIWEECFKKAGITAEVCGYNKKIKGDETLRIFPLPEEDNWWGPAGETGPCGPCSEMFYDVSPDKGALQGTFDDEINNGRVMEIWNDVFMEFNKSGEGKFIPLANQNVDTGMGVERTLAILDGKRDVFDCEIFKPILDKISEISGKKYEDSQKSFRVIADHIKAAAFILGDNKGISPSNVDQGYILRRFIRRSIRHGKTMGINEAFTTKIAEIVIGIHGDFYTELKRNKQFIMDELSKEEKRFSKTLEKGLREFEKISANKKQINGKEAFLLFQSYGFPIEMTEEIGAEKGIEVNHAEFYKEFEKHQELSRLGAEQKFKGGLADASDETRRLHTATHILAEALRRVLKSDVKQRGSNITSQRLRYDFSFDRKMTDEEKKAVEDEVNKVITQGIEITRDEMDTNDALKQGAQGEFGAKYPPKVTVYSVGDYSKEICMGPHVDNTSKIGDFKIKKEEASSAGVRRIKAVVE